MPHYRYQKYNNNNFHRKAPFQLEGNNIIVQPQYYQNIKNTWAEKQLLQLFDEIKLSEGVFFDKDPDPDNGEVTEEEHKKFFQVYNIQLRWYDADKWHHVLKRPNQLVSYNETEKLIMKDISRRIMAGGSNKLTESEKEDLNSLIQKLNSAVKECDQGEGCFVKLSGASTKHDYAPSPIYSGSGCLIHLLGSRRIFQNLNSGYILIQPWNLKIQLKDEFRVFVEDNKVIGITQQAIYQIYQECISIYSIIVEDIVKKAQELWDSIKSDLEYSQATLDVWMDFEQNMELIEINTYQGWCAPGSGWFDWENDFPDPKMIKSLNDVEVRLTYPNQYFGIV